MCIYLLYTQGREPQSYDFLCVIYGWQLRQNANFHFKKQVKIINFQSGAGIIEFSSNTLYKLWYDEKISRATIIYDFGNKKPIFLMIYTE